MKVFFLAAAVAFLLGPLAARADDHGHGHKHGHKEKYWDGACQVEHKWKHGEYTEKRKCKPVAQVYQPAPVIVQPAPVYVQPAPVVVQQPVIVAPQPGITVQGTVHLK